MRPWIFTIYFILQLCVAKAQDTELNFGHYDRTQAKTFYGSYTGAAVCSSCLRMQRELTLATPSNPEYDGSFRLKEKYITAHGDSTYILNGNWHISELTSYGKTVNGSFILLVSKDLQPGNWITLGMKKDGNLLPLTYDLKLFNTLMDLTLRKIK